MFLLLLLFSLSPNCTYTKRSIGKPDTYFDDDQPGTPCHSWDKLRNNLALHNGSLYLESPFVSNSHEVVRSVFLMPQNTVAEFILSTENKAFICAESWAAGAQKDACAAYLGLTMPGSGGNVVDRRVRSVLYFQLMVIFAAVNSIEYEMHSEQKWQMIQEGPSRRKFCLHFEKALLLNSLRPENIDINLQIFNQYGNSGCPMIYVMFFFPLRIWITARSPRL